MLSAYALYLTAPGKPPPCAARPAESRALGPLPKASVACGDLTASLLCLWSAPGYRPFLGK